MRDGVSVLIPVYNGARYLSECIESVRDQTLPPAEIIVVDDGSEDETPEIAAAWGADIRYHRLEHGGLPYARNRGLELAHTEFIAFIDSDDVWLPTKLEIQMEAISRETGPVAIFGYVQQFVSADLTPREAAQVKVDPAPVSGCIPSTFLARKRDVERVGPFDESIQTGEFIEWFSRAKDAGFTSIVVPEIVCRRRIHRSNLGRGGAVVHRDYVRMLKQVLDRRRSPD